MKRFYSFLLICFTVMILMVATIPNMRKNVSKSAAYSSGYEAVYKVESLCDVDEDACKTPTEALRTLQDRINYRKWNDRSVVLEGNDQIKVRVSGTYSEAQDKLEEGVEFNKVVTVGDTYAKFVFSDIFDPKTIEYSYNSSTHTYSVSFKATEKGQERLSRLTGDLYVTVWDKFYDDDKDVDGNSTELNDLSYKNGVIRINYSDATHILEDSLAMCYGNLGVKLTLDTMVKVPAQYESKALVKYFIAVATVTLVIAFLLIKFYRRAGALGAILTVFANFFTFIMFYWLKGEYSYLTCAASMLSSLLSAGLFVYITQKIRASLYKGRSLYRAFFEGYQKSIGALVDTTVLLFGAAIVTYFAYKGALRDISIMTFAATASATLFISLGYFAAGSLVFASRSFATKNMYNIAENNVAGLDTDSANFVEDRLTIKNVKKHKIKFASIVGGFLLASLIVFGVFQIVNGNGFNYSNGYTTNSVIRVACDNENLATKETALKTIKAKGLDYDEVVYGVSTVENEDSTITTKYVVSLYGKGSKLSKSKDTVVNALKDKLGTDYEDDMVYAGTYKAASPVSQLQKFVRAYLFTLLLFVVYYFVRFGIKLAIAMTLSSVSSAVLYASATALIRAPFDSSTIALLLVVLAASAFFNVIVADKIRSLIHEKDDAESEKVVEKSLGVAGYTLVLTGFVGAAFMLVLMAMGNKYNIGAYGAILLAVLLSAYVSLFIITTCWKMLRRNKLLSKKISLRKIKVNPVEGEPKEYTFTGIND